MVLPALGPEPTRRGSIHGGIAGHFLHGVAPWAATSTSVGHASDLALARAAALLLLSVPCLVCSCYCSCSHCCSRSRSCSCLRCCSDLATLQLTESTFRSVDFQEVGGVARRGEGRTSRSGEGGSPERYPTIYLRVQDGAVVAGGGGALAGRWRRDRRRESSARGPRGMAGAAADRRWGVFSGRARRRTTGCGRRGAAVWPLVASGSGGWRLKMNRRPLISYPTAAKSTDQR